MDANIQDLQYIHNLSATKAEIHQADNRIRTNALQEVAIGMGARAGLSYRTKMINNDLKSKSKELDKIFDFRRLLISGSKFDNASGSYTILPPVILEANNITVASDDLLKIADRIYKIEEQAKFVTNPPTWTDYLVKEYPTPEKPNGLLLPKDADERVLWKKWVDEGWVKGVAQADSNFELNLARMKRDIEGMIKYRQLLNMNMVSKPFVAEAKNGVTGGGNEMAIDDRTLRITAMPSLNSKSSDWKPIVSPNGGVGE